MTPAFSFAWLVLFEQALCRSAEGAKEHDLVFDLIQELTRSQWLLVILAAIGIGVSKSGLSGVSLLHVIIFAFVFGARASTGILLPLLVVGDVTAVTLFGKHGDWKMIRRLMLPAIVGVVVAALVMNRIDERMFRPMIGLLILALSTLQITRWWKPHWFEHVPHAKWFAWSLGMIAGIATMLANAAGPIVALYLLASGLPKKEFVGTSAWFFLILNLFKIPFSAGLGLITADTFAINVLLVPAVVTGIFIGRWLVAQIPQRAFDSLLLIFAALSALKLLIG